LCIKKNKKLKKTSGDKKTGFQLAFNVFTRHKPIVKQFPHNQVITRGMDDLWQIDLADLQKFSKYNDNNRYLVIDI
jgi:hypothetical protein